MESYSTAPKDDICVQPADVVTSAVTIEPLLEPPVAAPTADPERIAALDLIRGVAILGILAANIPVFAGSGGGGPEGGSVSLADKIVKGLTLAFVDVKFITQLAILFGAGIALQADKAWGAGRRFTLGYLWRTFLLLVLGAIHALLLWFGDILFMYACLSVVAVFLVRLGQKGLLVVIGAGLTWTAASVATLVVVSMAFDSDKDKEDKPPPDAVATPASLMQSFSEVIHAPADEREKAQKKVQREFGVFFSRHNQNRIYREGSYGEQTFDRLLKFLISQPMGQIILGPQLLACFLFGAFLTRSGFFSDPEVYGRWRPWFLAGGLILGVPLHVASLILTFAGEKSAMMSIGPQQAGALGIALVYLTLLTGWAQSNRAKWWQDQLKAVGRLALSNYLLQTVICTTIFYSFGFALYGTLGRPMTLLVVLGVWLLQLLVSPLYLEAFRIGPVEWLWRSLALRRRLPILKGA
jgi:uncharacterized protein